MAEDKKGAYWHPVNRLVDVNWHGAKYSINAFGLATWTTPEETRPSIPSPTLSAPMIGMIDLLSGPLEIAHPELDGVKLFELMEPSGEVVSQGKHTTETCVLREYTLWVNQHARLPDGSPGQVELSWPAFPEEKRAFATGEEARVWADSFNDPLFHLISHEAVPGDCQAFDTREIEGWAEGVSNSATINIGAIRRLMMGDDPNAQRPTIVLTIQIPGFKRTRTSGNAGAGVVLTGRFPEFERETEDNAIPDVTEQDIPGQTITVTINPDDTVDIEF